MEIGTPLQASFRPLSSTLDFETLEGSGSSYANPSRSNSPIQPSVDSSDGNVPRNLRMDTKVCGVCGDKALGNNFNAITCESCKAFFRRNALKQKGFVCPFNDSCKVDPVTRRFCQKCRLKKCFEIGMKKEWIMSDEEKKLKKRKIEQNKVKRQGSSDGSPVDAPPAKTYRPCVDDSIQHASSIQIEQDTLGIGKNGPSSADSTTFDHVLDGQQISIVQSSDITCSPSSNSNSSSDMGYIMAQFVGTASAPPLSPPFTNSQGLLHQSGNFQNLQWTDDGCAIAQRPSTTVSHAYILPHLIDREPIHPASLSPNQVHSGGQAPLNSTALQGDYCDQLQSRQLKPKTTSPFRSSSTEYEMPLLSSLIRPCDSEPRNPNGSDTSTTGLGPRNPSTGMEQNVTHHQSPPHSMDLQPSRHVYNSTHKSQYKDNFGQDETLPINTMDSIEVAIRAEFTAFGVMCKPQESLTKDLNGAEVAKLKELLMACEALGDPVDQEGHLKLSKHSDPKMIDVINLTDIAIRRLIKMSKKISAFKNMCQEDQIALLKGGCVEIMILRSVVTYDPDRDSWNIPHSYGYNIKLGVLKEARGNLYEEHQRFVKSFKPEWRQDEKIMILLCAITLFTAERPNVIHKEVVKLEQDSYYYLLKRYLESILNGCEARSTYLLLIRKIAELRILNSTHLRVFLEVNPREVEPLLREVFSMV